MEELLDAKSALSIVDIYFRDETVKIGAEVTPPFWPECARTQFKMVTRILRELDMTPDASSIDSEVSADPMHFLEVEFSGGVRCLVGDASSDDEMDDVFNVEVKLGLLYAVTAKCSAESLEEFVRLNVPYHAIPYWREHVHAACAKRRFPPITVPLYTQAISRAKAKGVAES